MAFKDKHDVWSEEEDNLPVWGWKDWVLFTVFVLPWCLGLGVLVAWVFDL